MPSRPALAVPAFSIASFINLPIVSATSAKCCGLCRFQQSETAVDNGEYGQQTVMRDYVYDSDLATTLDRVRVVHQPYLTTVQGAARHIHAENEIESALEPVHVMRAVDQAVLQTRERIPGFACSCQKHQSGSGLRKTRRPVRAVFTRLSAASINARRRTSSCRS